MFHDLAEKSLCLLPQFGREAPFKLGARRKVNMPVLVPNRGIVNLPGKAVIKSRCNIGLR